MIVSFNMAQFESVLQMAIATSSTRKFAAKCGLNFVTVYRMAYKQRMPTMIEFIAICTALDIEPCAFFLTVQQTEKML